MWSLDYNVNMKEILTYKTSDGKCPFQEWFDKLDKDKLKKNTISFDEISEQCMKDIELQKEYLNISLEEYITDGDFNKFYKSLEKVIKSRESVSSFAQKVNIDRSNLYSLFNGEKVPRLDTIAKILKELGYNLKVA